ncbi:hypothetical protein BG004_002474 [Podila humilis]|nr:hypothetical protein BG004_002474 [Podila humilis]
MSTLEPSTTNPAQDAILVTGGAGFIGSHTVVQLLSLGLRLVVVDNLCNSSEQALHRSLELAGNKGELFFHQVDLLDGVALEKVFELYTFSACIHFAGLKAVGESAQIPLGYYQTNVTGTLNLLQLLQRHNCRNLIFSSSATVYGLPTSTAPIREDAPTGALNPYGRTKQYIEEVLRDLASSEPNQWNIIMLRYFNPVGAHESGKIGEDPNGIPNNLMPFVAQVAIGRRPVINVFGDDYDTPDGTGVRDYIHIVDLAKGHVAALQKIQSFSMGSHTEVHNQNNTKSLGCVPYNLGSGIGYSVMDMIHSMSKAVGRQLPFRVIARRAGDVASCVADPTLSSQELNWKAEKTLQDMCNDLWKWQTQNPNGYETTAIAAAATTSSSIIATSGDGSEPAVQKREQAEEEEEEEEETLREDSDAASVTSSSASSSSASSVCETTTPSTPTPSEHTSSSSSSSSSSSASSVFSGLPVTLLPIISTLAKPTPVKITAEALKAVVATTTTTTTTATSKLSLSPAPSLDNNKKNGILEQSSPQMSPAPGAVSQF